MARPTKFTPAVKKKVIKALRLGATYELAAGYAGISYVTFNTWMTRGRDAKSGEFFEFFENVNAANGEAAVEWLKKIEDAATNGVWQAAAWKLERRHPDDYGRTVQSVEHSGKDGEALTFRVEYADKNDNPPEST